MTKPFFTESDCIHYLDGFGPVLSVKEANRLIKERSKVVYGRVDGDFGWYDPHATGTHQALLICVEKIEADSAEKIVRDLYEESFLRGGVILSKYLDRAKRLLGEKK